MGKGVKSGGSGDVRAARRSCDGGGAGAGKAGVERKRRIVSSVAGESGDGMSLLKYHSPSTY
eukprot:6211898-Pleurochrysis_carterae.AAC.2